MSSCCVAKAPVLKIAQQIVRKDRYLATAVHYENSLNARSQPRKLLKVLREAGLVQSEGS